MTVSYVTVPFDGRVGRSAIVLLLGHHTCPADDLPGHGNASFRYQSKGNGVTLPYHVYFGVLTTQLFSITDVPAPTSHMTVMSPRDSAAWDGAPTLAHTTYASPATGSLAQHGANVPTLLPAAPRRLRVPRARATQAAAGHPHA